LTIDQDEDGDHCQRHNVAVLHAVNREMSESKRSSMLLNFSEMKIMSSTFLGLLAKVQKRIQEKRGELTLINVDPKILQVFRLTRLDKVFKIV